MFKSSSQGVEGAFVGPQGPPQACLGRQGGVMRAAVRAHMGRKEKKFSEGFLILFIRARLSSDKGK